MISPSSFWKSLELIPPLHHSTPLFVFLFVCCCWFFSLKLFVFITCHPLSVLFTPSFFNMGNVEGTMNSSNIDVCVWIFCFICVWTDFIDLACPHVGDQVFLHGWPGVVSHLCTCMHKLRILVIRSSFVIGLVLFPICDPFSPNES